LNNRIYCRFDKKYLSFKMVNADPIASQIAINQCEAELSALGERRRLAMRVRDILTNSEQHYLSIENNQTVYICLIGL
jgi:hypothetical protein